MRTQFIPENESDMTVEYFTVRNKEGQLLYGANLYIKNAGQKTVVVQESSHNKNFLIMDLKRLFGISTDREMRYRDFKKWYNSLPGNPVIKNAKKVKSKFAE